MNFEKEKKKAEITRNEPVKYGGWSWSIEERGGKELIRLLVIESDSGVSKPCQKSFNIEMLGTLYNEHFIIE